MPDAAAGETIDHVDAKLLSRSCCIFHFLRGALVDSSRVAVSPNVLRQDRLMTLVDIVQDSLAGKVSTNGMTLQTRIIQ